MSIAQNPASCRPCFRVLWAIIVFCFFPAHPPLLAFTQSDDLKEAARLQQEVTGLRQSGKYDEALPLAQRALVIYEKVLGPDDPKVAGALSTLADLYKEKEDYGKAEPLYQRALAITERAFGPDHYEVAHALMALAIFYERMGDYSKAEPLLQHALAITEKAQDSRPDDVTSALFNLARLYERTSDYGKAESLLQRILAIFERVHPNPGDEAGVLSTLARLSEDSGDYGKAEALLQRALAITEKALDPDAAALALAFNDLAELYERKGDYGKAEPLLQRCLTITEKANGPDSPAVARPLSILAHLYEKMGAYDKAEPLYQRALAIWEKTTGPGVTFVLNELAQLYELKGDYSGAVALRTRSTAISETNIRLNLAVGSERYKSNYLATISDETNRVYSLHLRAAPSDPAALRLALTTLLRRKGRALDAMTESINALRQHLKPEQQALLDQLTDTRARLATLIFTGPGKKTPQQHRAEVRILEEQAESLEDQISRQSAEYRAQSQPVTIEAVQASIPSDAALAEFVSYEAWNAKRRAYDERRYGAYVLSAQGEAKAVDLGDADSIDEAVRALRAVLRREGNKLLGDVEKELKPKARALDELVMRPVRKLLGDQHRLLISPDGALCLIPFAALVDENSDFLVKHYSISYLTSGRDLLRLQVKLPSKRGAAVIADPDFNASPLPQSAPTAARLAQRVNADKDRLAERKEAAPGPKIGGLEFKPLTRLLSTADEAREFQKSLPGATVLTGNAATKGAVKSLSSPAILHVATHGFFLEDQTSAPDTRLLVRQEAGELSAAPAIAFHNPLLRSGLFFAGANTRGIGSSDDGILTALEASSLDLYGTKLVVLSACDTGLGDVKNGDGVYGLRRALVLAGSETQVMSLWSVSDKGTSELMIDYYKRLKAGEGRSEALRNAQLQMLTNPKRRHPYFWAAFIQSGEWANLDGKR